MTREEAIEKLQEYDNVAGLLMTLPHEVCKMAIADMEKQIPKKPLDVVTDDNEFICMICPSCEQIAVEFNDNYCRRCGQALDWSEEND